MMMRGREAPAGDAGRGEPGAAPAAPAILVVDDDASVLAVVARALRSRGFEVTTATDGREALRVILGGAPTPHLLVTDVDMPHMTGIELAARLRAARPAVRVVLMTADAGTAATARDRPELVDAVLAKPFGVDDLIAVVAAALRRSSDPHEDPRRRDQ